MLLSQFVEVYATQRDIRKSTANFYRFAARAFERWAACPLELQAASDKLNAWVADAHARNQFTARAYRAALIVLLRAAEGQGLVTLGKVRPVRVRGHQPRAFWPQELAALLAASEPDQAAAILVAYDTAFRRCDVLGSKWSQVVRTESGARLVLAVGKTGRVEARRLRLDTVAACERARQPNDPRLIPTRGGLARWHQRWATLGQRAGVDVRRRGLQAIRRTAATQAHRAGQSASDLLGHSTPGLARTWYLDPSQLDDAPPLPPFIAS